MGSLGPSIFPAFLHLLSYFGGVTGGVVSAWQFGRQRAPLRGSLAIRNPEPKSLGASSDSRRAIQSIQGFPGRICTVLDSGAPGNRQRRQALLHPPAGLRRKRHPLLSLARKVRHEPRRFRAPSPRLREGTGASGADRDRAARVAKDERLLVSLDEGTGAVDQPRPRPAGRSRRTQWSLPTGWTC